MEELNLAFRSYFADGDRMRQKQFLYDYIEVSKPLRRRGSSRARDAPSKKRSSGGVDRIVAWFYLPLASAPMGRVKSCRGCFVAKLGLTPKKIKPVVGAKKTRLLRNDETEALELLGNDEMNDQELLRNDDMKALEWVEEGMNFEVEPF